jgi:hypothetical protein
MLRQISIMPIPVSITQYNETKNLKIRFRISIIYFIAIQSIVFIFIYNNIYLTLYNKYYTIDLWINFIILISGK